MKLAPLLLGAIALLGMQSPSLAQQETAAQIFVRTAFEELPEDHLYRRMIRQQGDQAAPSIASRIYQDGDWWCTELDDAMVSPLLTELVRANDAYNSVIVRNAVLYICPGEYPNYSGSLEYLESIGLAVEDWRIPEFENYEGEDAEWMSGD